MCDAIPKHACKGDQYDVLYNFCKSHGTIISLNKIIDIIRDISTNVDGHDFFRFFSEKFNKYVVIDNAHVRMNKNIMYYASRVDNIEFTTEQKNGIKKIIEFIISNTETTFGFYGYAGTGKTTVLTELASYMIINGYIKTIAMTAPTNKAVGVIKSKFRRNITAGSLLNDTLRKRLKYI